MLTPLLVALLAQADPDAHDESPLERAEKKLEQLRDMRPTKVPVVEPSTERLQFDTTHDVWCGQLAATKQVPSGQFRVQCNEATKVCLVAPKKVLKNGVESRESLDRVEYCQDVSAADFNRRAAEGYRFVTGVADAPDGWYRDDDGRIVQVNFDLHRRVYFGGAYAPVFRGDGPTAQWGRGRVDFGIEIDAWSGGDSPWLHRFHILEASAWLGADPRVDATLIRYDWSVLRRSAPLWITTFIGRPRRFDLDLNLTAWFEGLRYELIADRSYLTLIAGSAAFDLWHSEDLQSYVRLRLGPAAELDILGKGVALRPEAAIEADLTFDRDGFHHLTGAVTGEKLFFEPQLDGRRGNPQRLKMRLGYEVILLAINDYPLTFTLEGRAQWRDDLPGVKPGWDFQANAGLRFSFWAPARRDAGRVTKRFAGSRS